MTRDSKDRHTWRRKIPSHAVDEARRRVGLENENADASPDQKNTASAAPSTRSSWLPSLKFPGVRRTAVKAISGAQPSTPPNPRATQQNFEGGSTLPWKPDQPSQPAPLLRANVLVDPDYLDSASGGGAAAAARSGRGMADTDPRPVPVLPTTPVVVRGGRLESPLSVREALATIDAAAAQRSAQLHSVTKSSEVRREAALDVIDAAIRSEKSRASSPELHERRDGAAVRNEQSRASSPGAQVHAMRSPSLTAAPDDAASEPSRRTAPVLRMTGPVTSAQAQPFSSPPPMAAEPEAEPALRLDPKPAAPAREQVFREAALRAKSEEPVAQPLPEVTGSGWSVLLVLSTLLMIGLGLAYVGRVEQTSVATGVLQISGGPRPVLSRSAGPVLSLEVQPGDSVKQGQVIARIDATDLNAREQRDVAQLSLAKTEKERIGAAELARLQADQRALRTKRSLLEERARLKADAVRDRRARMEQVQHAAHEGVATQGDALAVREAERAASEELLLIRQSITETDLQITDVQKNYRATVDRLRHDIDSANTSLAETRTLLGTTEVRAPVAGRVESLQVAQGQVVGAGSVLARIVPDGAATMAVVFAPAKDASFLREGLDGSLEFASLPVSEFGKAPARVTRVSKDVASHDEIMSVLGSRTSEDPVIRVELELLPSEQLKRVQDKLRSGERLTARLNTRDRRMITLLFDFMRKWYDP